MAKEDSLRKFLRKNNPESKILKNMDEDWVEDVVTQKVSPSDEDILRGLGITWNKPAPAATLTPE